LYKVENAIRWGIPMQEGYAYGFQMMLPVKWRDTSGTEDFGLGDLELRVGMLGRLSSRLRFGIAMNAQMETATSSLLSENAFLLRPIAALSWDYSPAITWGVNVEYSFAPLDERENEVRALEVKFPVVFRVTEEWSGVISYNPRWDFLGENDRHRLELAAALAWGADNQFAWSIGSEIPLRSENLDFKWTTGFSWFF
jgi:hypothetical protein